MKNPEARARQLAAVRRPEYRQSQREKTLKRMYAMRGVVINFQEPNGSEEALFWHLYILFGEAYRWNDGWFALGRKFPDFVNVKDKKFVELAGELYHEPSFEVDRPAYFREFGDWETLIVWDRELRDESSLQAKLQAFQVHGPATGGNRG